MPYSHSSNEWQDGNRPPGHRKSSGLKGTHGPPPTRSPDSHGATCVWSRHRPQRIPPETRLQKACEPQHVPARTTTPQPPPGPAALAGRSHQIVTAPPGFTVMPVLLWTCLWWEDIIFTLHATARTGRAVARQAGGLAASVVTLTELCPHGRAPRPRPMPLRAGGCASPREVPPPPLSSPCTSVCP